MRGFHCVGITSLAARKPRCVRLCSNVSTINISTWHPWIPLCPPHVSTKTEQSFIFSHDFFAFMSQTPPHPRLMTIPCNKARRMDAGPSEPRCQHLQPQPAPLGDEPQVFYHLQLGFENNQISISAPCSPSWPIPDGRLCCSINKHSGTEACHCLQIWVPVLIACGQAWLLCFKQIVEGRSFTIRAGGEQRCRTNCHCTEMKTSESALQWLTIMLCEQILFWRWFKVNLCCYSFYIYTHLLYFIISYFRYSWQHTVSTLQWFPPAL